MVKDTREFEVHLLDFKEVHELPNGWPAARLLALLESLEVDDVAEGDAMDMALMALSDLDADEAADRVLEAVFGDTMRAGVRRNLAHDLTEDRPWEDFADMSQQAGIFNAVVLLQQAFPREYGKPDAVSIRVALATSSEKGRAWLDADAPDPALLLRILAAGMDDRAVLRRVFAESLRGSRFPEAGTILWHVSRSSVDASAHEFMLVSSHQWFDPLEDLDEWNAAAWVDAPATNKDKTEP